MPSSKSLRFLVVASVLIILISAGFFFVNLRNQIALATRSFEVENKINQLNQFYKTYLDLVVEKRRYQSSVDPASKSTFENLELEISSQLDSLVKSRSGFEQFESGFQSFFSGFQKRMDQLKRHVGYFDHMSEDSAKAQIVLENLDIQLLSGQVELDYQELLSSLFQESDRLKREYFAKARFNSFGFLVLFLLSIVLILVNYFQGRKQQKLEVEKKIQQAQLEMAHNDMLEFQATFDHAAIGMGLLDESGKWIKVNASLCRMLGYTPDELLKKTFQDITHPDDLFKDMEFAQQLFERKINSYSMEKRYFTSEGEIIWINLNGTAVRNEDGSFRYFIAQIENINPRKLAYQALQEQKERFENVIRGTKAGIWEWNIQTGETVFNEIWAEIIGYSLDELGPISIKTWEKFAHPEDLEKSGKLLEKCFTGESEYYECECRMRHRDGHWVWVLDRGKVLSWTYDGKPEKMFGTHMDISRFKSLEDELLKKEAFIQAMLDTIDIGIVACDANGNLNLFNKATMGFHGIDTKEIDPTEWAKYYHLYREDGVTLLEKEEVPLYRAWKGEVVENQVICIKHISGRLYFINTSGYQIKDELGRTQGAVVAMKDITESRQIALEIENSERKFKGIFNSTFQFIGFLEPDGKLIEANQTALDFGGLLPEDVVGKKFWDCFWWQISPETQQQLEQAIYRASQGEFVQYEVAVWDKDKNPVTILFNLKPLRDKEGEVIAIIPEGRLIQDIVDARKSLEEKNHELERFASVASHDLKEPLRMVVNFLQLLERKYKGKLDEKADQYIHFAVDASQRMNVLISDLLEFSKIGNDDTDLESIDMDRLVQDQKQYFATLLEESNGKITSGSLSPIHGKKVPVNMLFRNLIGNAIKYRKREVPLEINIEEKEYADSWEFIISDNGIGFDPSQAERIFEMFKRLHTNQEFAGTGLGLAICKKIVEQHHGRIWAESSPGQGSAFHFTLSKN
ncbi:PAS domain S-box protein [Algoriphagus sp. AK58]|uniref:PAS domain S-box protein n=1 Tax=Algoriphagus sp. AK58 TaxID=1406877 RepID=UPI00164FCC2F|nr:PAS domain S-box protein [Algoriphagus sp. AK58]MBC6368498.1 hypothetical protein [Algoriphagus sp. AK58]